MKNLRRKFRNQKGFNLIELMIVIAIIALLIGVGVPAWTYMVQSGNETSAIKSLDTMRTMQSQYAGKHQGNFGTFKELVENVGLDSKFSEGDTPVVNGYIFKVVVTPKSTSQPASYKIYATPQVETGVQKTGSRSFYMSSGTSTVKFKEGKTEDIDENSDSI
ncbi:MAG: prepilin-type N-terminal cleavage/methylation domain-containing protein [Pyrinomonadaceae bacterium]